MGTSLSEVFTDIADAIRYRSGNESHMYPSEMAQNILNLPGKIRAQKNDPVRFYQPDGNLICSATLNDIADPDWELPEQPDWTVTGMIGPEGNQHSYDIRMTPQGWNYTKQQILDTVAFQGFCEIGAIYKPADGKTHIIITVDDDELLDCPLYYKQSKANGVTIDFGDGSPTYSDTTTQAGTRNVHTWAGRGTYDITFTVNSGTIQFGSNGSSYSVFGAAANGAASAARVYESRVRVVLVGDGCPTIHAYAFQCHYSCTLATIPNGVTQIGQGAFLNNYCLPAMCVPSSVTVIRSSAFQSCVGLVRFSMPLSVTTWGDYLFQACSALKRMTIPSGMTSLGTNTFYNCQALDEVYMPSSITTIGTNLFWQCFSLTTIHLSDNITELKLKDLYYCVTLSSFNLPSNLVTIGQECFRNTLSYTKVVFPSSVTTIAAGAFYGAYGVQVFDFRQATQVPTIANITAFSLTSNNAKIVVPDALYDTWITSTNWSDTAIVSKITKASDYEASL